MLCLMAGLVERASIFQLLEESVIFRPFVSRRHVEYPSWWLNDLGWVFTYAACSAIGANLTFSLINICDVSFDVTNRWRLFLVCLGWAAFAWLLNQGLVQTMQ